MFFATTHKNGKLVNHVAFTTTALMHEWLKLNGYVKGSRYGWYTNGDTEVLTERLVKWDPNADLRVCVTIYETEEDEERYAGHLAFESGESFSKWLKLGGYKRAVESPSWYTNGKSTIHYEGGINLIDEACMF